MEQVRERNRPLSINVHVIDIKTDKEEDIKQYRISRAPKVNKIFLDCNHNYFSESALEQVITLDKKTQIIMNLLIWAMNSGKELHFVRAEDDE